MEKLKVNIKLIDKHKIFSLKAKYDPSTRIAEAKRGFREKNTLKFEVDPDHIYEEVYRRNKRKFVVYVDSANRKSIEMERVKTIIVDGVKKEEVVKEPAEVLQSQAIHTNNPIDMEKAIKLDYLIDVAFWKSVIEKRKLALSTVLTFLVAGIGIYTLLVLFLRACGINV
ncbi:MAG: hypothetical protein QW270_05665 [Candidatus Bathyarchaeia archaeon]